MFNSSVIGDSGKVSAGRSSFSKTCALLSRYVKEKKAFGDLSFELASKIDGRVSNKEAFTRTTMNLFPVNQMGEEEPINPINDKSVSLFPEHANTTALKIDSSEIKSAPMTIFYGGQVIVFNDFPAYKMKEIMELANLGSFQNSNTTTHTADLDDNKNDISISLSMSKSMLDLTSFVPPRPSVIPNIQKLASTSIPTIINDLPQKRRASLYRFMGKRRERIAAKAPYMMSKPEDVQSNSKMNEYNPWLELASAGPVLR